MSELVKEWRVVAPMIAGFSAVIFCPISSEEGAKLTQRPPSIVFKIVWPILYALLGLSWKHARTQKELDVMHGICTFLLTLWILVVSCQKNEKLGIYVIACSIAVVVCCMSLDQRKLSSMLLSPLLAWLLVAFQLNWHLVDHDT